MKKIIETIKSLFSNKKYSCYVDYTIKINAVYKVVMSQVRLFNIKCYNCLFSIIPTEDNIIIKFQTSNNSYNSLTLSLMYCCVFNEEELINYINKQLEALIKEAKHSFNCYKTGKNEKNN